MSKDIDWSVVPYDHKGKWSKNIDSVMHPNNGKVTLPQFLSECIIYYRTKFWSKYKNVRQGQDWWKPIARDVRNLNLQSPVILSYFPHPSDEPLILPALKNWIKNNRPTKIGQFRKSRTKINKKTGRLNLNVTKDEQDTIMGIKVELDRLVKQRESFSHGNTNGMLLYNAVADRQEVKTEHSNNDTNKSKLNKLLDLEKKILENG